MEATNNQLSGSYLSMGAVLIWALPILTLLTILKIIRVFAKKHYPSFVDTKTNHSPAPHCSSSSSPSPPRSWDVFLSFHGKDTRRNFTSHLYSALVQAGFQIFSDDPALQKGEEISAGLFNAIRNSKMFVVVISENYARSSWCLDELVEILSCKRTVNQVVPVFYYLDPSDIRYQKGSFGEAFYCHKKRYTVSMIQKWKSALEEIAGISGYHLKKHANDKESDMVREIVENVEGQASAEVLHLEEHLIGMDSAVEEIFKKLNIEANHVGVIGICGMGGIGKTTTAKAFYNKYSQKFDISCFIENEKQTSPAGGIPLLRLLEQLLIELLRMKKYKVPDVKSGIRQLKRILCLKKALIVLDDLEQSNNLELLVMLYHFLSAGSRIMITTRDVNLLNQLKVEISEVDIYMVEELGQKESLELFSYHVFRKASPPENFRELSIKFVDYVGGLPLALKVLGSSVRGRTHVPFWEAQLEKVRVNPEINKILNMSYDALGDETEKAIFLDIVFFFIGKDRDEAVHVFESCDFYPEAGIPILVERCLLRIDEDNKLQMHNLIQEMGRQIIRKESKHGKCTRLYLRQENACKVLQNIKGKDKIEGLILDLSTSEKKQMSAKIFESLPNLRLLQIIDAQNIRGNFKNAFHELRCIRWHDYPWTCLPSDFSPTKLVSIDMPSSQFKTLWKGLKPITHLANLRSLNLSHCCNLKELPEQLGDIHGLKMIDASYTAIENLPDSIAHLKELVDLKLISCKKLKKLPADFGNMRRLRTFDTSHTAIENLPDSIVHMKEMVHLRLRYCKKVRMFPMQFGYMEGLRTFIARSTAIKQLPRSFSGLVNLVELDLMYSRNLRNLPNSIWMLKSLKVLNLAFCSKLEQLPEQLGKMQCLEELRASDTTIEGLPDSIGLLSRLQVLDLRSCKKLKYLPSSMRNLTSLATFIIHHKDIIRNGSDLLKNMNRLECLTLRCDIRSYLPVILGISSLKQLILTDEGKSFSSAKPLSDLSLSKLPNLHYLLLENCTGLGASFPDLPSNLTHLSLCKHASLEQLPNLLSMKQLSSLRIESCINLQSLPPLPPHLLSLKVHNCTSLQDLPDLSMMKELIYLSIIECNNLKVISLKQSSLQVGTDNFPSFRATLPNMEIAEWFSHKSTGRTVSFDIPPNSGHNFLGIALWVVYKCKTTVPFSYIRAVIINETESTEKHHDILIHANTVTVQSNVECTRGDRISVKSGDRIQVSFQTLLYSSKEYVKVPTGVVEVEMCGAHVIQNTPSIPCFTSVPHKYLQ